MPDDQYQSQAFAASMQWRRTGVDELAAAMIAYLASFARMNHPQNPGGTAWLTWSHEEGGPKRILLDADKTEAHIRMFNEPEKIGAVKIVND